MTQALFTAMTGLNAGTQQLSVVSDNVANMNTTAYKTSRVNFQDIWYQTKTVGTNASKNVGGTNPYQVGVGVKCASISKDFSTTSVNTTGKVTDMAIEGSGWFTILSNNGEVLMTRDGTFSLDEDGNLCTAKGYKVLGMDCDISPSASTIPVKIPIQIQVSEYPTKVDKLKTLKLDNLNNSETITDGDFKVTLLGKNAAGDPVTKEVTVSITNSKNMMLQDLVDSIDNQGGADFSVDFVDGAIQFSCGAGWDSMEFSSVLGGTNFVSETTLSSAPQDASGNYTTKQLNISADILPVDDIKAPTTRTYKEFSVGTDGLLTVTYDDGSALSIKYNTDGSSYFSYENKNAVLINGDTANSEKGSLIVDSNLVDKANLQMQFAKVTNDEGMVAVGSNMFRIGVNAGDTIYSASNHNGVGSLTTGALESSNVDLAQQLSNMILAQRLVQANAQIFSGANEMLQVLTNLGR